MVKVKELIRTVFFNRKDKQFLKLIKELEIKNDDDFIFGRDVFEVEEDLSIKDIINKINHINKNIYSNLDKFLALMWISRYSFILTERDSHKEPFLIKKLYEDRFLELEVDDYIFNNNAVLQLFKLSMFVNNKEQEILFGEEEYKVNTNDKMFISIGSSGKISIYGQNIISIDTDSSSFKIFYDKEDGYIQKEDGAWKHFKKGEDPVKRKVYDNFETVDNHYI